jgi:hypothetical protein
LIVFICGAFMWPFEWPESFSGGLSIPFAALAFQYQRVVAIRIDVCQVFSTTVLRIRPLGNNTDQESVAGSMRTGGKGPLAERAVAPALMWINDGGNASQQTPRMATDVIGHEFSRGMAMSGVVSPVPDESLWTGNALYRFF